MSSTSTLCCVCHTHTGTLYPTLSQILKKPVCQSCLDGDGAYLNHHHEGLVSRLPSFSLEFEVHSADCARALALLGCGYLRTADGTVSDEYKSPIYHSLAAFRPHLPVLHSLSDLVDDCCGTHLHLGFPTRLVHHLALMRRELFGPLARYLKAEERITRCFWGRSFGEFASLSWNDLYPWLRFPTTHGTLEYRLPRFRDAAQYLEVVRFCRRTTTFLQRSLETLETLGDLSGEQPEAARLGLTPAQMGEHLLVLYHDALSRLAQARRRADAQGGAA